ncbi:MAG: SCP2 sterol-binding domain-containing protein [Gammaproteobacteria bacterium]|nr:SCP2 sterol-binding domain-containing protein [Gammaproteobacteria bacterium]
MDRFSSLALRPLEDLINHGIARSPGAQAAAAALDDKSLDVRIDGTPVALRMVVVDGVAQLSQPGKDAEAPAATAGLSGPPITMLRLMGGDPQTLIRTGEIQITGSPDTADQFRELLYLAKPDIETELARLLGQSAAHQLGSFARGLGDLGARTGERLAQRLSEYLTVEQRSVLTQAELNRFLQAVDTLANDVERAAARVERLRNSEA